jgi:hypothetical protein
MTRWMTLGTAVALLASCTEPASRGPAASAGQAAAAGPGASAAPDATHATLTADAQHVCAGVRRMAAQHCGMFANVDAQMQSFIDSCQVVAAMYMASLQDCMQKDTCEAATRCAIEVAATGTPYRGPTASCAEARGVDQVNIPVGVSAEQLEGSYGRHDRRFSDSPSSASHPIEVCALDGELGYLTRVTCDDGSRPFGDRAAAEQSRSGNAGPGGRCGRIIDRYQVRCPERAYEVFVDSYRCPAAP